jgi:hypothetical protein
MIKSRKHQLVTVVLLACICIPLLGAEPDETKRDLEFEIRSDDEQKWTYDFEQRPGYPGYRTGFNDKDYFEKDGIIPTHVAIMIIKHVRVPRIYFTEISNNPIGRTMSKQQQKFIAEANGRIRNLHRLEEGFEFRWYAVSQEDAKKMAQAFIDVWNTKVNTKLQPLLKQQQELQEKIAKIKKMLPEKLKQAQEVASKCKEIKDSIYFSNSDAIKKAKETIIQMANMLDVLEIELAGIQEKLSAIEEYRKPKGLTDHLRYREIPSSIIEQLDKMYVEQIVEFRGVESRKKTALNIQSRENGFLDLFFQKSNLEASGRALKKNLNDSEKILHEIGKILAKPEPNIVPPKVYQDKVTIYPVKFTQ